MLIFQQKQVNPFSNGEKLPKFCKQLFCPRKNVKNMGIYGQKNKGLVP